MTMVPFPSRGVTFLSLRPLRPTLLRPSATRPRLFLVPVLVSIAAAFPLFGTALQQLTLTQLTQDATEIVQGTVASAQSAQSGSTIFTVYTIQVQQRMKGNASPSSTVAIPGGSFHGIRQSFPGVPVLIPGHQYLLFLWTGSTGPTQLVGLGQGVFEVGVDTTGDAQSAGQMVATRPASTEIMLGPDHQPVVDRPVHMKLAEAHRRIQAALAQAAAPRPVKP